MMSITRIPRSRGLHIAAALLMGTASAALLAPPAHAQVSAASLRGTITENGQPTATSVTIVETATGYRRTGPVSANGQYNFPSLRPGTYRLEVTTPNGVRNTDTFTLQVAQNAQLDFDLADTETAAEGPGEDITAGGDEAGGAIIVTASKLQSLEGGEVGTVVSQRLIEQLPQNNRNFLAFADLAPGVQFQTDSQGNASLRGGAQGRNTVNVFIDGVSQKDYILKNGITGQDSTQGNPFPQLAIGEYRVISSNYKAEFDQVSSAAITAVTKSGTNEFHGEGFFDFSNQSLREKTPAELWQPNGDGTFGRDKVKTRDMQFGAALGGPIIKDVMHFFVTYEGKRRKSPVTISPGLNLNPDFLPDAYQGYFGAANSEFNEDLYFGKIDIVPTSEDLIELSAKYRDESGFNLGNGSSAAETASATDTTDLRAVGRWQHTADTWINDFKLSYQDAKWAPTPRVFGDGTQLEYDGPSFTDPGATVRGTLLTFGGGGNYQDKGQKGWTVQDDFTFTGLSRHTFKVGAKASWIKLRTLQLNRTNPLYIYNVAYSPTGDAFNDTVPYRVQFGANTGTGSPIVESNNFQLGLYAQDDWDVTDRLTLNIGIRWDYERVPSFLNFIHNQDQVDLVTGVTTDPDTGAPLYPNLQNADYDIRDYISTGHERKAFTGAFQPRVGFSYKLDEGGKYTIFGGYGRSYDRNQFDFLQQEVSVGAYATRTFNFDIGDPENECAPSPTCVPFDPVYLTPEGRDQLLAGAPFGGGAEMRFIKNDLKTPYSDQFSLGMRGRFGLWETEIGYSHVESHDGFVFLLGNRRPDGSFFFNDPANPADTPNSPFGFSPPGYGSIILGDNGAETSTDTAYVKVTKPYTASSPWSLDATYTYTEAEENRLTTDQGAFSLDFPSLADYPTVRAVGIPRHRLVMAASADLPLDFIVSAKFQIESPTYVRQLLGFADPFERTVVTGEAKGNGDRWGKRQMDLSLTKFVPIGLINDESQIRLRLDVINLFNDRNYVDFQSDSTAANYLERTGYSIGGNPPRTIKLSAGFSF